MLRGRLEQYYYIQREIQVLGEQLAAKRRDSLTGEEDLERLRQKRGMLTLEKRRLEEFVDGVEDNRLRLILTLRYLEGLEWGEVAAQMGHRESSDSVRKAAVRFLEKSSAMSANSGGSAIQ